MQKKIFFSSANSLLRAFLGLILFASGGGILSIKGAVLTVSGLTAANKTYDGNATATVDFSSAVLNGVAPGDMGNVALDTTGYTASFADKNAGAGKSVTVAGLTLTGSAATNYTLTQPTLSADIALRSLGITATGVNKTYSGNTNASVALGFVNKVSGDSIAASGTASFATKAVGIGKTVFVGDLFITGPDADNYDLTNFTATATANISAKTLRAAATGVNKAYDGNTTATVTLSDNHLSGDAVTLSYASATFDDQYVGDGKTIAVTGIAISGGADAGNYVLNSSTATAQANVTPRTLTVIATGVNKAYDGNTNATVTLSDNRLTNDNITVSFSSASFNNKNVANSKTVTVYGLVVTGPDSDSYTIASSNITTTANITGRSLTVAATGVNRVYDGTTNATVTLSDNRITGDNLTNTYTSASFADKNVGNAKTVNVAGIALTGPDAVNYSLNNTTASTPANITSRSLTVSATGQNRAYDGTTAATVTLSDNRVAGDSLTTSYSSAVFANKNVGNGKTVTVSGIQVNGTDAGNYSLSSTIATTTATITGLTLTVSATGVNRVYNGTTNATVTLSDNRVSGDSITVNYSAASFADKNAGNGKTISVTGISLGGSSATNYTLANTETTTTANITGRSLTVGATGSNKVYDGTTTALVTLSDNHLSGDVVTVSYTSANFASAAVGTAKAITVSGLAISGGPDAGNYSLNNSTAATQADITQRILAVTATGVNKAYDGTTNASVTLSDNRLTNDNLTVTFSSASFTSKNAGTNKTVNVYGLVITGTDADSYVLTNTTVATTANISSRNLTVVATGVTRVYDGTTNASVTLTDTRLSGDNLTNTYNSASFNNKNVGSGKAISVVGIAVVGPDAGNYSLLNSTASTQADITNRSLTVSATGVSKTYDGTTNATVTLGDNRVTGDSLTDSYTSAGFANKNVANGIAVNVTGIQVTGGDAGNYFLSSTAASTTANITGRTLTVAPTGQDKTYDGGTTAAVTLSDNHLSGDTVSASYVSANFSTKQVGNGKTITVSGISISGANAGNYTLASTNATATANITARSLVVTATGVNKVYDGTLSATVTLGDNRVGGDTFTASYGSANFTTSTVGNGKIVNVSGIFITGTDAGNYSLSNTTAATAANITAGSVSALFTSSANPSGFRDPIAFSETLPLDATGTVTFFTNGVVFNSSSLAAGAATSSSLTNLLRGTNLITAVYSGDGNYSGLTNTLAQVVTNHPPVTGFFSFSVTNGVALKVRISDLLTAVADVDSDAVTFAGVSTSTNGVVLPTNSAFILFRNTNYVNDQFSYTVTDGHGGTSTGQVSVASVLAPFTGQNGSINPVGGTNALSFSGIPNYVYIIQRSVNLISWVDISTNTAASNGAITGQDRFTDLGAPPASAFYRLKWKP